MNLWIVNIILIIIIIAMFVYPSLKLRRNAKVVGNEEFAQLIPTSQLIDIQEAGQFRVKHILGARNISASQFPASISAVSTHKPVLLYEIGRPRAAANVAKQLKKAGVPQVYILKEGLTKWDGKVKAG